MRPFHVDLVSEHASPLTALGGEDAGGQNVYVAELATELGRLGCRVRVFTRRDDPQLPDQVSLAPHVVVEYVSAGPPRPIPKDALFVHVPEFADGLARRWLEAPPDVIHAHFWMSGWAAVLARAQTVGPQVPLLQTFHALGVVKSRHQGAADTSPPQRQPVEASLTTRVDQVVATCFDEMRELTAMGGDSSKVTVIPCGIDPTQFQPDGLTAPRGSASHRLVVVSRLVRRKGIDDAIVALGSLPDTELVVAGGPAASALADDPEYRRLRRLADRHGVGSRVGFTGGLPRSEVPALLRSADVVVSSPWYEPFGIVPLEAMACGTPVVATAVGGQVDTVQPERTGVLVEPRDPAALAQAVGRLLGNPSLRNHMGQEAAALVRERFTWAEVACSMYSLYESLSGGSDWWAVSA
jgi:D-inositol-3-phosphate glycosyltransferase